MEAAILAAGHMRRERKKRKRQRSTPGTTSGYVRQPNGKNRQGTEQKDTHDEQPPDKDDEGSLQYRTRKRK